MSIIGEYVKLKRVGNSSRGPCPFHGGKDNNFSVTARGYKCFVCGETGGVFTFVQKHLGLDFVEAVSLIGAKTGIEVPEVARRTEDRDTREPLWEVNGTAADVFRTQLWEIAGVVAWRATIWNRAASRARTRTASDSATRRVTRLRCATGSRVSASTSCGRCRRDCSCFPRIALSRGHVFATG